MKKTWKKLVSAAVGLLLLCPLIPSGFVTAEKTPIDNDIIAGNEGIVYFVNAGSGVVEQVAEGDRMGVCQSRTDQELGADPSTGYTWGYYPDDEHTVKVAGGSRTSTNKLESYWYMSDQIVFSGEETAFRYDFELPNGEYEVTIGARLPVWWDSRSMEIEANGGKIGTLALQYSSETADTAEVTGTVTVTNQKITLTVSNSSAGDNRNVDPILNYIKITKGFEYSSVNLQEKLDEIKEELQKIESDPFQTAATQPLDPDLYLLDEIPEDTLDYVQSAMDEAERIIEEGAVDEAEILAAIAQLDDTYNNLRIIEHYDSFSGTVGAVWKDTNGIVIQAHGGQVLQDGGRYYWVGEDKTKGYRSNGISLYVSDDLYNWEFLGFVMRSVPQREALDNPDLYGGYFTNLYGHLTKDQKDEVWLAINGTNAIIERPKIVKNEKGQWVIWFHADGQPKGAEYDPEVSSYAAAAAGVATADSLEEALAQGFTFIKRERLHRLPDDQYDPDSNWYEAEGNRGMARDMTVFIDDDGTGYIIYSSEENRTMFISRLNEDYTDLDVPQSPVGFAKEGEDFVRLFPGAAREAPAMFQFDGKYYLLTSGLSGWDPNRAEYWVADEIFGEWKSMGDPCISTPDDLYSALLTFSTQSTNVIEINRENGLYIYMGDRWFSSKLEDSRYVWLPISIGTDGRLELRDTRSWNLDDLSAMGNVQIVDQTEEVYINYTGLPAALNVKVRDRNMVWSSPFDAEITWDTTGELGTGKATEVTGTFKKDGISYSVSVSVAGMDHRTIYFADSGSTGGSAIYDALIRQGAAPWLRNQTYDQAFDEASGWGYTGTIGTDIDYYNANRELRDNFASGWWAYGGKTIDYRFALYNGNFEVHAGFNEWWNTTRYQSLSLTYTKTNGETVTETLGTFTNPVTQNVETYSFEVTDLSEENPYVSLSVAKTSGADPILSWLSLTDTELEAADKTALLDAISKVPELLKQTRKYTQNSLGALKQAYEMADAVSRDPITTQIEVDTVLKMLNQAIGGLVKQADKQTLQAAVDQASKIDLANYKDDSNAAVFRKRLQESRVLLSDSNVSEEAQDKVNQAAEELLSAIEGLIPLSEPKPPESGSGGLGSGPDTETDKGGSSPSTGDYGGFVFLFILLLVAGGVIPTLAITRKKQ